MSKEQQGLLDEAYENYVNKTKFPGGDTVPKIEFMYPDSTILSQEEFINKCKTNNEFSKKWGLKIEERELSTLERMEYYGKHYMKEGEAKSFDDLLKVNYVGLNIPTKLITLEYNGIKIESYE